MAKWSRNTPAISLTGEEWRPIPGFENIYEASSVGRVRRLTHWSGSAKIIPTLVGPRVDKKGYIWAVLCSPGRQVHRRVSHLVLEAFGFPRPEGMEADHRNGVRSDNSLTNLRWITHAENIQHKITLGTSGRKLTDEQRSKIREARKTRSLVSLAEEYGVHFSTIARIDHGTRKSSAP